MSVAYPPQACTFKHNLRVFDFLGSYVLSNRLFQAAIGKTLNMHRVFIADSTKEMFAAFFPSCPFVRLKSLTP
jgi:hypothetical protein